MATRPFYTNSAATSGHAAPPGAWTVDAFLSFSPADPNVFFQPMVAYDPNREYLIGATSNIGNSPYGTQTVITAMTGSARNTPINYGPNIIVNDTVLGNIVFDINANDGVAFIPKGCIDNLGAGQLAVEEPISFSGVYLFAVPPNPQFLYLFAGNAVTPVSLVVLGRTV